jgi:lysophospholipase L1-like esterase
MKVQKRRSAKMKMIRSALVSAVALSVLVSMAPAQDKMAAATTPAHRMDKGWWKKRHTQKLELVKKGDVDLVFIGDSITHSFEGNHGKAMWAKYYAPRKALNLGYSGDRTEHVIWRIDNGELEGLSPKLAVIMIGTNNTGHRQDPPEAIAAGIRIILDRLRAKQPKMKILLLAIFPRGAKTADRLRVINDGANELIAKFADNENIFFLSINDKFLAEDGTLTREIMPDLLHPRARGYQIWAETIEPMVAKLMAE